VDTNKPPPAGVIPLYSPSFFPCSLEVTSFILSLLKSGIMVVYYLDFLQISTFNLLIDPPFLTLFLEGLFVSLGALILLAFLIRNKCVAPNIFLNLLFFSTVFLTHLIHLPVSFIRVYQKLLPPFPINFLNPTLLCRSFPFCFYSPQFFFFIF